VALDLPAESIKVLMMPLAVHALINGTRFFIWWFQETAMALADFCGYEMIHAGDGFFPSINIAHILK
jgi:hypothetical protein